MIPETSETVNGKISYWYADAGMPERRKALPGDVETDVAIVGAGFTGLWTAYYLKQQQPGLRVVIVEKEFAGFGASGRNGGWVSAGIAGPRERYAATHGRESVKDLSRVLRETIDEIVRIAETHGIDADIVKSGVIRVARNRAQEARLRRFLDEERTWGAGPDDIQFLSGDELSERVSVSGAISGSFSPHNARVQPAKLVRGLSDVVERMGVAIYEDTAATDIVQGQVRTDRGIVRAPIVLRCLEGFTPSVKGGRRRLLPMNSSMIVTDPLDEQTWDQIGWAGAEAIADMANAYMYAQRTIDGRIAIGGRGNPYRFGSRTDAQGATHRETITKLAEGLHSLFPGTKGVSIAHGWCGVLGVPRDWCTTVTLDKVSGVGSAGGYAGIGLTASNLAGRTLADLVLGEDSEITRMPWVDRASKKWEPEPVRWLGVQSMYLLYRAADRRENGSDKASSSRFARVANTVSGHS